jgi:hypothetical protein
MHVQHISIEKIQGLMEGYNAAAEKLDERMINLQIEHANINKEVVDEDRRIMSQWDATDTRLNLRATIGIFLGR